jgi:hypothetical protein
MHGRYGIWPRSVHGKLFFLANGNPQTCSGTVIQANVVATAGHCVSDGRGRFHDNLLFCPQYYQEGRMPGTGCWAVENVVTSSHWHQRRDLDYDYACLVTRPTGTEYPGPIGERTGWAGVAFNIPSRQPIVQFGYPSNAPFAGDTIQQVISTEWYEVDTSTGGQRSKYVGSDLNGGSSGGGWFLSWRHPRYEYDDTDASIETDPSGAMNGPFLNGLNSHKRCKNNCASPPSDSQGIYWQEMGSPVFQAGVADDQDALDIFTTCWEDASWGASPPKPAQN